MKDCPIAHGDEGEGVILISWAFFHSFHGFGRRLAAREDPFGGGDIVLIVAVLSSNCLVFGLARSFGCIRFRKSEFEI